MPSSIGSDQPRKNDSFSDYLRRYRRGRHTAGSKPPWRAPAVAAGVTLVAIGAPWFIASPTAEPVGASATGVVLADTNERAAAAADRASRDLARTAPAPNASPPATMSPSPSSPPPSPTKRAPVPGLGQSQMDNAAAIIAAGRQLNLPRRAFVVAIATALQESNLRVLANPAVAGSMSRPNQGAGYDHDSVGLFQQRPNWGSVDQLMDPQESARRFYAALVQIPGWEQLAITVAAQRVQVSAFPNAYAKHQALAEQIVDAIA